MLFGFKCAALAFRWKDQRPGTVSKCELSPTVLTGSKDLLSKLDIHASFTHKTAALVTFSQRPTGKPTSVRGDCVVPTRQGCGARRPARPGTRNPSEAASWGRSLAAPTGDHRLLIWGPEPWLSASQIPFPSSLWDTNQLGDGALLGAWCQKGKEMSAGSSDSCPRYWVSGHRGDRRLCPAHGGRAGNAAGPGLPSRRERPLSPRR